MRMANNFITSIILLAVLLVVQGNVHHLYGQNLSIEITSPQNNSLFAHGQNITFTFDIQNTNDLMDIRIYNRHSPIGRVRREPWEFVWKSPPTGFYGIVAMVRDRERNEAFSDTLYIRVGQVLKGEMVVNGGFRDGLTKWGEYAHAGTDFDFLAFDDFYFDDPYYFYADIRNGSDTNWHIQLTQNIGIRAGHTYEVSFWADAEDEKPIGVNFQENGDDYTVYHQESFNISQFDFYGPFIFECVETDLSTELKFLLGANTINFFLDNVSVIDQDASDVETPESRPVPETFRLEQNFPNPFNMTTIIPYQIKYNADVTLDIYNMQGRHIKTLINGFHESGSYTTQWNGTDNENHIVPSGVYLYRLSWSKDNKTFSDTQKLVLTK